MKRSGMRGASFFFFLFSLGQRPNIPEEPNDDN